jgi:hypothetical protein
MQDVYARGGHEFKGSFSADAAKVVFAGGGVLQAGGLGLLTQGLNVSYQQQISRIYEIGSQNTYYVGGRTQGSANLERVFGPRAISVGFYKKYGDVCAAGDNTIDFSLEAGCNPGHGAGAFGAATGAAIGPVQFAKQGFTLHNCVITSMGFSVRAQDMIINEQVQMMFAHMDYA